ncbi:MAG TPA: type I-E CRISPR-associated protein Cse1/CasA [Paenalcaligenes sp.]|nr:type I-E CRISPR-associated protein Cse1/CasA [Paenalcaligenes sp.]
MENKFNLIDEPWIPIADYGLISLRDIFSNNKYRELGGNPIQKIAIFKLLLAISQAAVTPSDEEAWQALGTEKLAHRCLTYLEKWHDKFYLYGERPFLQMPKVLESIDERTEKKLKSAKTPAQKRKVMATAAPKAFGAGFYPDLPSDNNTLLSHTLIERDLQDHEKALFILTLMNFSFGGKRIEADLISLAGQKLGNRHSAKAGPSLGGFWGYLHSFVMAEGILSSLWLNLLTEQEIKRMGYWTSGLGDPPWESMPADEAGPDAEKYKNSYMATLIALSRFVLLKGAGIYYLEGIAYPNVRDGWFEPSLTLDKSGKDIRVKYVDPEKKPWRELESLLGLAITGQSTGFECQGIKIALERARDNFSIVSVWSGGLRASSNSGDQSVKQSDDFVESKVWLETAVLKQAWFDQLKLEMEALNSLSAVLYARVNRYFSDFTVDGKNIAKMATNMFWHLCERDFQQLVQNCEATDEAKKQRQRLRRQFANYQHESFDCFCPSQTARQIDAWARNRPSNYSYVFQEVS